MIGIIVAGVVALASVVIAYKERKSLKADVEKVIADGKSDFQKYVKALATREQEVRSKISNEFSEVINHAKAEAEKAEADVKGIVAKIEADVKKVL